MPSCFVPECSHVSRNENCSFFRFPTDTKLFEQWKALCLCKDRNPTNKDHLCSCHFIDGNRLNLPTVFAHCAISFESEPQSESNRDGVISTMETEDVQTNKMFDNEFECRACLEKMDSNMNSVDLFQAWTHPWEGMESTIAEDLAKVGNILLSISDRHSKVICDSCYKKLENACSFAAVVKRSDNVLRQRYPQEGNSPDIVWPKPIQLDKNLNGTAFDTSMGIEIKQEVLSDNDYNEIIHESSEEHYKELPDSVEIKIEPEEMMGATAIQINRTFSCKTTHDNKAAELNGNEMLEEYLEAPLKEEPTSENDSDPVCTDLHLECMLCAKSFHSVSGLKAHVIAQHSYKSVKRKTGGKHSPMKKNKYVCATCRRSFVTSTDLMVHETCHKKATCYGCNQKFDTFEQLTGHRVQCKVITTKEPPKPKTLEDVQRTIAEEHQNVDDDDLPKDQLQCHLCPEKFSDSYYMTIHQEIHHSSGDQVQPPEPVTTMETETLESIFSEDK